jgi:uroporphyrin-3 C-methyltransferase
MTGRSQQQQNSETQSSANHTGKPPRGASSARLTPAQLVLSVLVLIFLWQWLDGRRDIDEMRQQLASKIAEMAGNSKAGQLLIAQNQQQTSELLARVTLLETRYAEAQNQRTELESLYHDLSANRDRLGLVEVEQMLLLASQQLQLSGNAKAALIALQSADESLRRLNRSALAELRKEIDGDMAKLRGSPDPDIAAINIRINGLIRAADKLPLVYQQHVSNHANSEPAPPKDETSWQRLLREIWQEMKQLVRIENTGKADLPLLPPDQEFYLRENLKLRLLSARLALLSRDESSFRQEVDTAQLWVGRYFDGKSGQVAQMQGELKSLAATRINEQLPDIGPALQMVRNYLRTLEYPPKARLPGRSDAPQAGSAKQTRAQ